MTSGLRLSDLLASRFDLQWQEGVAVVRGVASRLLVQQGAGLGIPELHQIELTADGAVVLNGGSPASMPVRRMGQLLQAVLTDVGTPVQLRLVVSLATAPAPQYPLLADLDRALAYFERPDRVGLIKALFLRADAAGALPMDNVTPTLDTLAPLLDTNPMPARVETVGRTARRPIRMVAVLLATVAISAAAVVFVRTAGMGVKGRAVSLATGHAADALGTTVLAGVSAVSDRLGLGRIVDADAADKEAAPGVKTAAPSRGVDLQTEMRRLPAATGAGGMSRIELIIARDGSVESARLLGNHDVQGGMLLSAAKTWKFRPAMKDGIAVRYRKTVLVAFE